MSAYTIDHNSGTICQTDSYGNQRIATPSAEQFNHVQMTLNHLQAAYLSNQMTANDFNDQRETLLFLAWAAWED